MTKFKHYTILIEVIISVMLTSAFAIPEGSNGLDTILIKATIYDHYAMNPTDNGYFEFNPMASGESQPGICEERVQGMVQQTLGPDSLPRLNQFVPCAYNMNLNNWFKADPDNPDPKKRVLAFTDYLSFQNQDDDKYHFSNSEFFPLDDTWGTLVELGIEEEIDCQDHRFHNLGFTMHFQTEFTYLKKLAEEQKFDFTGGDDAWVFIDGILVMDFGGIHNKSGIPIHLKQLVDSGLLNLTDGQNYKLDFFFAKRHTHNSNFNLHLHKSLLKPTKPLEYHVLKVR